MKDLLDEDMDHYLGNYLKNWAARQAVPFHSKEDILRSAKLGKPVVSARTAERIFFWRDFGGGGRRAGMNPFLMQFSQVGIWTPRMLNVMRLLG
jgi:hypothetical protein